MSIAQSLSSLLVHLIFSTKDRFPFLAENELMLRTHGHLGGILREADCPSLVIGGTADHVHAFFRLSRTQTCRENSRTAHPRHQESGGTSPQSHLSGGIPSILALI